MQQGGQDDNDDERNLLRLMVVIAAAQKRANKASGQGEQVQNYLRHAPGPDFGTLAFVITVKKECDDAETEKPAGVKWKPAISEVKQERRYPRRDQEKEEGGMTHLERRPLHVGKFYPLAVLCVFIQNISSFLKLSVSFARRPCMPYTYYYTFSEFKIKEIRKTHLDGYKAVFKRGGDKLSFWYL